MDIRVHSMVAAGVAMDNRLRGGHLVHEGDTVRFHMADIVLPSGEDLPRSFRTAEEIEGTVVNFSDFGLQPRVFAVIDVIARQSVIVPVEKLEIQNIPGARNAR